MKQLQPNDLDDLRVTLPHQMFVQPFLGSGFTKSGIYLEYDQRLYPVLARVLVIGPEVTQAQPGGIIIYQPGSYDWIHLEERSFATMDERAILARVINHETLEPIIEPIMENVLLIPLPPDQPSGIQLVRHRDTNGSSSGTVIAKGPQAKDVSLHDSVAYDGKKALVLKLGTEPYHLIGMRHIFAVLEAA